MGRGRVKGKKLSATSQDDPGSGEEEKVLAQKRRGRPQKPLKDEIENDEAQRIEDKDSEDTTTNGVPNKDIKNKTGTQNGKKRKRNAQANEEVDTAKEEKGNGTKSVIEESKISNGFRQNRRKNKPRRAAEAVVECS
ncbi:hypothetical protein CDL12_10402 [Handroanthus impetiginosus]|uniref:Uncharacterized protein n=1 Tax=Handroanthus impetiginosus TaxID=429701 RepID=A0A2G9HHN6_9LAMI|nr:hypothetical protein CDL12_10402 [Handroanthus impetiginosus]